MKKGVKRLLIGVAVLFAVLLVAPSLLSGKIAAVVKSEANKMLTARLDFEKLNISLLRHFPNASLELKGLTLVGVERFEGDTIVAAERISVVVSPLSLLGDGGFEVKKVLLSSPRVHGHKLEDGTVNWDVMRVAERGEEVTTEVATEEAAPAEGGSSFSLALKDFRISDAVLRYEDDSTKMY
ncbi:MAG: AsmA family protein, partial [Alistipes sp.]|nr:AsmA family protein [Alistipes sp.]